MHIYYVAIQQIEYPLIAITLRSTFPEVHSESGSTYKGPIMGQKELVSILRGMIIIK